MKLHQLAVVAAGVVFAVTASAYREPEDGPAGPLGPTFEVDGYTLEVLELESEAELELTPRGEKEYSVALECWFTPPEELADSVVAVSSELKPIEIRDTRGDDIIQREDDDRRRKDYRNGTFKCLGGYSCKIELDDTDLTRDAYRIHGMTLELTALVAKEIEYVRLPASATTTVTEGAGDQRFRVAEISVDDKDNWSVEIRSDRPRSGPDGAFCGTIHALDARGEVLSGGKFNKGDPVYEEGKLEMEAPLPKGADIKYVRVGIVTEYEVKTLRFEVTDIVPD